MTEEKTMADKPELSTKQVAEAIGTDAKTFRVFLRSQELGVGAGKRYAFEQKDVAPLKTKFNAWTKEREAARKAKAEKAAAEKAAAEAKDQEATVEDEPAEDVQEPEDAKPASKRSRGRKAA
jgi:hypothetical protein